jgi:hypothetical protein
LGAARAQDIAEIDKSFRLFVEWNSSSLFTETEFEIKKLSRVNDIFAGF